jgi:hypothetical protein
MNWWLLAGATMALICAAGHAIAGWSMFYRPIKSDLHSELHAGLFAGMWHIITINFTLSAIALIALSNGSHGNALVWFISAQFAGYAAVYLVISLHLRGPLKLFQWIPFGATTILSAIGAITAPQCL